MWYETRHLHVGDYSWEWRVHGQSVLLPCLVERKRSGMLLILRVTSRLIYVQPPSKAPVVSLSKKLLSLLGTGLFHDWIAHNRFTIETKID